jgi:hypothetical protein
MARARRQALRQRPQVTYFDTPVIVDNALGGAITKAA